MSSIVEKPDGTVVVLVHLSLKPCRDDALIQLIRLAPNRGLAGIVREAMRSGIEETPERWANDEEEKFEIPDIGIEL